MIVKGHDQIRRQIGHLAIADGTCRTAVSPPVRWTAAEVYPTHYCPVVTGLVSTPRMTFDQRDMAAVPQTIQNGKDQAAVRPVAVPAYQDLHGASPADPAPMAQPWEVLEDGGAETATAPGGAALPG